MTRSGSTAIAAITSGQVWTGVTVEPAASKMEKAGTAKTLYDTRTPQGTSDVFGGPWPAGGFYVQTDFVNQNPRTVQSMVRAGVRTLKYIKTHGAAEIADHLPPSFYGGDKAAFVETLKANLQMFSDTGLMPPDGPNTVFDTVKTADPKTDWSVVDLKKTYDNSFVQKAGVK